MNRQGERMRLVKRLHDAARFVTDGLVFGLVATILLFAAFYGVALLLERFMG